MGVTGLALPPVKIQAGDRKVNTKTGIVADYDRMANFLSFRL